MRLLIMLLRTVTIIAFVVSLGSASSAHAESAPLVGEQLISYYANAKNYRKVKRDVLDWHKTTTNGCVAFASTALRHVGYEVPIAAKRDGWGVSRITFAFSDFLKEAGWRRIDSAEDLIPGDLAFTTGYPDHVFVFHSWASARRFVARVLDNKGHLKRRAMFPNKATDISAFSYALRAPL